MRVLQSHICKILVGMVLVTFHLGDQAVAANQSWTNSEGVTISAEFRGISDSGVHLRAVNSTDYVFPMEKLSAESQEKARRLHNENPNLARVLRAPEPYRYRLSDVNRFKRIQELGGTVESERAVLRGLKWLAASQNPDGSFGVKYHCAATGLSLLAMLGHGEGPDSDLYGDSIVKAALYLMERSKRNDGTMHNGDNGHHLSYEHGIATMAIAELYALTKGNSEIPRLESILKKSVNIIVQGQTDLGGWAYGYRQNGRDDLSLSGWQYQALHSARLARPDLRGVEDALKHAQRYLSVIQDGEGAFKYAPEDARGKESLTGAALFCMQLGGKSDSSYLKKGRAYLDKREFSKLGNNFYTPYYYANVAFHESGEFWKTHREKLVQQLIESQNEDGSWMRPNIGGHASEDSHHLNTAWGILMLEGYYRYVFPNP